MALLLFCAAASCGEKQQISAAFVVGGEKKARVVKCSSGVGSGYIITVLNVVVSRGFVSPCRREDDPE